MASLAEIRDFLGTRRIAVAGVSGNPRHFSRVLFREFRDRGYDVIPVNPSLAEVDGIPCAASVAEVSPPPEAVLIVTRPERSPQLAADCVQSGIHKIWMYRAADPPVAEDLTLISGECPLMYLPEVGVIHRLHGFCRKITGSYPK